MMRNSSDGPGRDGRKPDRTGIIAVVAILTVFALGFLNAISRNGDEVPAQADTSDTASSPEATPADMVVHYIHQGTNVRAGRSTDTEIVTTLARGDRVRTDGTTSAGWARVYPYGLAAMQHGADSALGYVYADLLADSPPPAREPSTAQAETQESQFNSDYYAHGAALICEDFLEDQLRAPSTAEYPWSGFFSQSSGSFATYEGDYTYRVRAHVDAENAFGAKVRTQFSCRVQYQGNYTWQLVDLSTW